MDLSWQTENKLQTRPKGHGQGLTLAKPKKRNREMKKAYQDIMMKNETSKSDFFIVISYMATLRY